MQHNLIEKGRNGFYCYIGVDATINYNTFREFGYTKILCIGRYSPPSYPTINGNNIIIASGSHSFVAVGKYGESPGDIDASLNWWGTNDTNIIRQNIVDNRYDNDGNYSGNWQIVYQPIEENFVAEALPD